ncbi:MAG: ABC transporter permease [Acidimicrobiaceae bacterium]|nr:ABC transporter permease [Acidimicrobiaceae bacterium]MBO0747813.1 ABC transporter permease [Acidimicrobiaceae bacterium]
MLTSIRNSGTAQAVVRRLGQIVLVMFGVTFMTYALMNLLPGGAAIALAGPNPTQERINEIRAQLHLDQPFLVRYWHWLRGAATGHLGNSLSSGQPVSHTIASRIPVTAELVILALIAALVLCVPIAILGANRPNGIADRLATYLSVAGLAMPNFVFGLVLILIFAVRLRWLPATGFVPLSHGILRNLRTMILPVAALTLPLFSTFLRVLRADLIDQMFGQDYVVTARSKGLTHRRILTVHALRNSLFSLITLVGLNLGVLMGGTVLIEEIFGVPGVGQAMITAITLQDVTTAEAVVLVIALAVVVTSVLTDVTYAFLDPRVRYGRDSR